MRELYEEITKLMEQHADQTNSVAMAKYMKNHFEFYGIKSPQRKELLRLIKPSLPKQWSNDMKELISLLWNDPHRECQYLALDILQARAKSIPVTWMDFIERLILTRSWWDTVDGLASNLVGSLVRQDAVMGRKYTDKWIASDNMWLQRTALIYQLKYKDQVNESLLYYYIEQVMDQKEFFIQKAIGWSLRQYSKFNKESVATFMDKHPELSGLARREGGRYL